MNIKDIERWKEMDRALTYGWGLDVSVFAKDKGMSEKQIKRDLKTLRDLGQKMACSQFGLEVDCFEYVWRYLPGVKPLFVCNLPKNDWEALQLRLRCWASKFKQRDSVLGSLFDET